MQLKTIKRAQSSGFTTDFTPIAGLHCYLQAQERGKARVITGTRQDLEEGKIK